MLGVKLSLVMRLSSFVSRPSTGSGDSAADSSPPIDSRNCSSRVWCACWEALVSNLGSCFSYLSLDPVTESGVISNLEDCSAFASSADKPALASVAGLSVYAEI